MNFTDGQIIAWIAGFMLPLFRIAALIMTMPVIGTKMVPKKIKLITAFVVTLILYPLLPNLPTLNLLDPNFIMLILQQLIIGITIGFIFQLVFQALIVAGGIIAMQSGLSFASLVDPATQTNMPVVSHFYVTMASLLFIALNGHLLVLQMVAESFTNIPISTTLLSQDGLMILIRSCGMVFLNAVLIALPAIVALLLANISLAVITRASPQMNIFSIGFPITLLMGFFLLMFSLNEVSRHFYGFLEQAMTTVNLVFQ